MLNGSGVVVWKKDDGNQVAVVCSNHDAVVVVLFCFDYVLFFGDWRGDDSEPEVTRGECVISA
jgi:hypothetical protein